MVRRFGILIGLITLAGLSWADKIIMRDGKIYQGHIMGETSRSILISNPPLDPKPRFIELADVLTIVRESRPAEKPSLEEGRFASLNLGVSGQAYSSSVFSFSPAPGLYGGAGFRIHPAVELGAEFNFIPHLSSGLTVTDGQNERGYDSFYAYDGGFSAKFFPFFQRLEWRPDSSVSSSMGSPFTRWVSGRMEPYLTTGYHWNRLVPNASGDELKGTSIFGGVGVMIPWWKPLYWDLRFLVQHTTYNSIQFLTGEGDLSGVTHNSYILSAGLSYRFL
jgi:hypothetical protein